MMLRIAISVVVAGCSFFVARTVAEIPFSIRVVDAETGRGVPLVELETVHHLKFVTDNAGIAAIDEVELNNEEVFFHVRSHGYEFAEDGFGYRGKRVLVTPGKQVTWKIDRKNIAERLYRLTGAGLYSDSIRIGIQPPLKNPLLNAQTMGSDSAHKVRFGGKYFWIWGDTNQMGYPLGNFQVTAATSPLEFDPEVGVEFTYFKDNQGFARKMAPFPGKGPTWLDALVTLKDEKGGEHLVATYVKVKPPLSVYERGLCEYDPEAEVFKLLFKLPLDLRPVPEGHPFRSGGYLYFGNGLPDLRIPDRYESWIDQESWEAIESTPTSLKCAQSGEVVKIHRGAISWSEYLKRWTFVFTQSGGKDSQLGEIWFSRADSPEGPWSDAIRILTHDRYSFYNPLQHPGFSRGAGRYLYFEGTYTTLFSGNPVPTPRYDYNQILYRLDLADKRIAK